MFGNENDYVNAGSNSIIFTIKDTKLYVSIVILSAKGNRKLSKLPCKGLERTVYWNQKVRIKIQQTSIDILLNQSL